MPLKTPKRFSIVKRPSIAMTLREYEQLVDEFCDEKTGRPASDDNVLRRLYLGQFILWLRKRQGAANGNVREL